MILAIDIGGTSVKLGLVDRKGTILAKKEENVSFDNYQTPIIETVVRAAHDFAAEQKAEAGIEGVGISATGQVDENGVIIGTNGKIPGYEGTDLKSRLEREFGVPAWALNDANAAALGECFGGAGKGVNNMLMVTLGTGVGGGIVINGHIFGGARGIAGELGHFTLYQDGVPCSCGKRGCYESYASTTALMRRACEAAGESNMTGRIFFARVAAGDEKLSRVLDNWLDDVAAGLTGLIHIFNPELILIGGGVSAQEELLIRPLREKVMRTAMPRFTEKLRLERAALGNDAGILGAAAFWLEKEVKI